MLVVNNDKKNGDTISCHACKDVFKLHSDKTFFEIELLNDKESVFKAEVDYVQVDRLVIETSKLGV